MLSALGAGVGGKIVAAFTLVVCCAAGLGLFASQQLKNVNATAGEIRQEWLPSTRALGELAYNSMRFRQLEATLLLAPPDGKAAEEKTMGSVRGAVDKAFATYAPLVSSTDEQRLVAEMRRLWAAYLDLDTRFLALSRNPDGNAAISLYRGEMRTTFNGFQDVIKADSVLNVDGGTQAADRGAALGSSARTWIWVIIGLVMVLCAGIGWSLVRGISGPITALTATMKRLADGDTTVPILALGRKDEIGGMAKAVQVFKENGLKAVALETEVAATRATVEVDRSRFDAERAREAAEDQVAITALAHGLDALANGNLTHQITEDIAPKTQQLKDDFNMTAARLRETITTIAGAIQGMANGTGEISQAADDLSQQTEQQAASLEQTAAALDEITATVRKTAEGATHVQAVVSTAKADAEQSGGVVREAVAAMNEIEKSSQEVSQIIGVIDEIAFQTNLLALNAGVEAARAGDAGRGFAVVASEVRALAQRSAQAAKDIKQLISTSSNQVGLGVKLVNETGESLQRIVGHVAEVHTAITEIAASAKEQATGLHEVNTAINQMDQVTQQNAAMVEQSTAATHALAQETAELMTLTKRFQLGEIQPAPAPASNVRNHRPPSKPAPRQGGSGPSRAKPPVLRVVATTAAAPAKQAKSTEAGWEEF
jgi:methyl-accepting chemotaxis protein